MRFRWVKIIGLMTTIVILGAIYLVPRAYETWRAHQRLAIAIDTIKRTPATQLVTADLIFSHAASIYTNDDDRYRAILSANLCGPLLKTSTRNDDRYRCSALIELTLGASRPRLPVLPWDMYLSDIYTAGLWSFLISGVHTFEQEMDRTLANAFYTPEGARTFYQAKKPEILEAFHQQQLLPKDQYYAIRPEEMRRIDLDHLQGIVELAALYDGSSHEDSEIVRHRVSSRYAQDFVQELFREGGVELVKVYAELAQDLFVTLTKN